jgi:flagellar motility protein MotE (MotC chaperone)
MMGFIRELRLIPIALIASACLLALKVADLALDGSSFFTRSDAPARYDGSVIRLMPDATQPPGSVLSWAQQMFNFPDGSGKPPVPRADNSPRFADRDLGDITGSADSEKAAANAKNADAKPSADITPSADTKPAPAALPGKDGAPQPGGSGTVITLPGDGPARPTGAERAILERLQERRQELDTRARELDIRESLIQNAEKRMEAQLAELKATEARIKVDTEQKYDAETARLKGLVTMYENMKPRDAAKIFDRLDITVLLDVASQIKPQKMSDIMAQMSPDSAERLTVELANKAQQPKSDGVADLPKIQGQSTGR